MYRHPQLVGGVRAKVPVDQVPGPSRGRIRGGGAAALQAANALHALLSHEALHRAPGHPRPLPVQLTPALVRAVGPVVVRHVRPPDLHEQPLIPQGPCRGRPALGRVVRRGVGSKDPADGLDHEAAPILVDVGARFVRVWSSSPAKKALADFKISLARRSSVFSLRSCRSSSRSSVVRPPRSPASISAWRTHRRRVS
jgi:hypothetical protein